MYRSSHFLNFSMTNPFDRLIEIHGMSPRTSSVAKYFHNQSTKSCIAQQVFTETEKKYLFSKVLYTVICN